MLLLNAFARLSLQVSNRYLQTSSVLYAEPLKKKKKLDPQVIKQREDRRRKKLEKQIRRLEKNARQLRPVAELEIPLELLDEKEKRGRIVTPLTHEGIEQRALLNKEWARYKHIDKLSDFQIIDRLLEAQTKALDELRAESEILYQEAIQKDVSLVPSKMKGPVATPPIKGYESPDGDYIYQTKNWE